MEEKTDLIKNKIPAAVGIFTMIPSLIKLLMALFRDKRVPTYLKILTAGAAAYVALPFDFLPEFVPSAGLVDDLIVILLLLVQYMKSCPEEVFAEHWDNIMGEDYDIEEDARETIETLEPIVSDRFKNVKQWIIDAAIKIGERTKKETPEISVLPDQSDDFPE